MPQQTQLITLRLSLTDAQAGVDAAKFKLARLAETYVRTVLGCPEGEIVVEKGFATSHTRFLVETIKVMKEGIYISGPLVKKCGELGVPVIGTFVDDPYFEVCLSNRLPR